MTNFSPFHDKNSQQNNIGGTYHYTVKVIYEKHKAYIIINGEKLKFFFLRFGSREGGLLLALLVNIVLEVIARAIRQEKEIKTSKSEWNK